LFFYYNKQIDPKGTSHVPLPFTWHVSQIILNILFPFVTTNVLNQFLNHWLLDDALHVTISMNLKLKEEMKCLLILDTLIIDDSSLDIKL
jgi:hypothetical protein